MLGLPPPIRACLFDLDGVLTQTATAHAAAWKEMFDAFLRARADKTGDPVVPFDPVADYRAYVDGKPRYDGVRSFLASRGIELPEVAPSNSEAVETVRGLGDRKNELVREMILRVPKLCSHRGITGDLRAKPRADAQTDDAEKPRG